MAAGDWFVIEGGEHDGRAHMAGWFGTAIWTLPRRPHQRDPEGLSLQICPRCAATIIEDLPGLLQDRGGSFAHERWHAATDHPIPPDVLAKVARP